MSEGTVEFDTVLDLCRDQHCRVLLAALVDHYESASVADLTEVIVEQTRHISVVDASEATITQIQLSLSHLYIPRLEDSGVIEYDPERRLVETTARFDRLQPYLSTIIEMDPNLDHPVEL